MIKAFFPRQSKFWRYHCTALTIVGLMQVLFIIFDRPHPVVDIFSSLLWVPLFTLAALIFRQLYIRLNWVALSTKKLIFIAMLNIATFSLIISAINLAIVIMIFSDQLFTDGFSENFFGFPHGTETILINNTISTSLLLSAWVLFYIGIKSRNRAHQSESDRINTEHRLKEAQFRELSNQLNPHFLFNSLNNIRFTIHENPDKADKALTALSDILRYSLDTSTQNRVSLSHELQVVKQYLTVVELHLEKRLDLHLAISDETQQYLIPRMSLQPLVENAIKHGIEPSPSGGSLIIKVYLEAKNIILEITNTRSISYRRETEPGTGLDNLKRRIAIIYSGSASLIVKKTATHYLVRLTLPQET